MTNLRYAYAQTQFGSLTRGHDRSCDAGRLNPRQHATNAAREPPEKEMLTLFKLLVIFGAVNASQDASHGFTCHAPKGK